jgi:RsiW-degrading membrane proteinase PrsW (M82 family)
MTSLIIRNSFKSGLLLFAVNLIFAVTRFTPILLLTSIILPGFLFGILLTSHGFKNTSSGNSSLFIILSGALYILTSLIATGIRAENPSYLILLATTVGAILLFVCYKLLLDRKVDTKQGLLFTLVTGAISSILPFVAIYYDTTIENPWIKWTCIFSVYPIWQTLFSWTLQKAKATANKSIAVSGAGR